MTTRKEKYLAGNGQYCPNCGEDDGIWADSLAMQGPDVHQEVGCAHCDATWVDIYRRYDVVEAQGFNLEELSDLVGDDIYTPNEEN